MRRPALKTIASCCRDSIGNRTATAIPPSFRISATNAGQIVKNVAATIKDGRFDLIWMPPPSYAGDLSAGYNTKQYFRLDNSYGSFDQHRAALKALLENGVEPVADLVINHREGNTNWADFKKSRLGTLGGMPDR